MARSGQCVRHPEICLPISPTQHYVPVPVSLTRCGLPPPLSRTSRMALRLPVASGVNVT